MARRLTEEEKLQLVAHYAETRNYSETARVFGVSVNTVKNAVKNNADFAEKCKQKKEEVSETVLEHMGAKAPEVIGVIDTYLQALMDREKIEKATVAQISTVIGTLLDKYAMLDKIKRDSDIEEELKRAIDLLGGVRSGI
ncbi:MAG: helix-turn-helix domain-containing protein [Christensenellaceae bacterium]